MSPLVQRHVEKEFLIRFDHTQIGEIMTLVKQNGCRVISQELQLFCHMTVAVPVGRLEEKILTKNGR